MESFEIRPATAADITHIKAIADKNKTTLGFIFKPALICAASWRHIPNLAFNQGAYYRLLTGRGPGQIRWRTRVECPTKAEK
jgi:hypothetical protein